MPVVGPGRRKVIPRDQIEAVLEEDVRKYRVSKDRDPLQQNVHEGSARRALRSLKLDVKDTWRNQEFKKAQRIGGIPGEYHEIAIGIEEIEVYIGKAGATLIDHQP